MCSVRRFTVAAILFLTSLSVNCQDLHDGLKPMIDLKSEGYVKVLEGHKKSLRSGTITECTVSVYKHSIVIFCKGSVTTLTKMFEGRAYRTERGKIIETSQLDNFIILRPTNATEFWIKFKN